MIIPSVRFQKLVTLSSRLLSLTIIHRVRGSVLRCFKIYSIKNGCSSKVLNMTGSFYISFLKRMLDLFLAKLSYNSYLMIFKIITDLKLFSTCKRTKFGQAMWLLNQHILQATVPEPMCLSVTEICKRYHHLIDLNTL